MAIRRSFQFNTQNSTKNDGIFLNQSCDVHGRTTGGASPFLIDISFLNRAEIGDYPGYKPTSSSLPARVVGGLEGRTRITAINDNITVDDFNVLGNSTAGNITLTLPLISGVLGKLVFIENIGTANEVLLTITGIDTIEGIATFQISARGYILLFADGVSNIWRVLDLSSKTGQLVRENPVSPTRTTVSSAGAVLATSPSIFFSGRPVLLSLQCNARDDKAAPEEYFKIQYTARWDGGGTEFILGYINGGNAGTHIALAAERILTPPAPGLHTVDLLWARSAGTGTMTMDNNDMFQLNFSELN